MKACYSLKNFSKAEESHSESTCQHTSLRACHPSSQISIPTTESQQSISRYGIRERRFFCHVGLCVLMATFFWKTGKFLLFPSFFFGLPPYSSPYSSRWYFVLCLCFWCQLAHKCLNPKSPNPIQWTWTSQVSMSYGTNHHIPHSTKWLKKIWISAC
jgi:hypothetical protein